MKKTEEKVINFIHRQQLISNGDRILVALSGGADSVFLLSFLIKYRSKFNIRLGAFHLNHQLRGAEADEDEKFSFDFCQKNGIPFYSNRIDIKSAAKELKVSLEEAGRICRYTELEKILIEQQYSKIATAHNAGDNSETVLLNLIKGTGLKGISGIPAKRNNIIRPLLTLSKEEILKYLEYSSIPFRTDSSNESVEFERNLLRLKVLPLLRQINPSLDNSLLNSSRIFGDLEKYLSGIITKIDNESPGNLKMPLDIFKNSDPYFRGYLIKSYLERNFSINLTFNDIGAVLDLINKETGRRVVISEGLTCYRERNYLFITRDNPKKEVNITFKPGDSVVINSEELFTEYVDEVNFSNDSSKEYISGDLISGDFEVRNWIPGDKFYPLGLKGSKKVSDYLNELKIDFHEKSNQLVLLNNDKLIWVIGKRLDNRFRITKNTNKKIQLWLKKK